MRICSRKSVSEMPRSSTSALQSKWPQGTAGAAAKSNRSILSISRGAINHSLRKCPIPSESNSRKGVPGVSSVSRPDGVFGWGGGLAIADMDGDGFPEIAYASTVFSTSGGTITLRFTGTGGIGGGAAV